MKQVLADIEAQCWNKNPTYFDIEKFAELIVKQCVSVVKEHYDDTLPWGGVENVLEHFGVEK